MYDTRSIECGAAAKDQESCAADGSQCGGSSDSMTLTIRRRRLFHRQACILSVMAAFALGLALGVFVPLLSLGSADWMDGEFAATIVGTVPSSSNTTGSSTASAASATAPVAAMEAGNGALHYQNGEPSGHGGPLPAHFPTIYDIQSGHPTPPAPPSVVADDAVQFLVDVKLPVESVFRNAFYLEANKDNTDTMVVKKLDAVDGTIKEFTVQRLADGLFRKSAEKRISRPTATEEILQQQQRHAAAGRPNVVEFVPHGAEPQSDDDSLGVIERDIYWGETVEQALPVGFSRRQTEHWNEYLRSGVVTHMEPGCGRMQNRMVTFQDGTRACARYRQNTDQIQGELFSFYLGRLLNITNLAPSGASVIDMKSGTWQLATADILAAQWKSMKPVVLTQWLPDLEPAGIPQPFQPLERHLNKLDVHNITGPMADSGSDPTTIAVLKKTALQRLVELAQWSDLIVFDYLIANLDRVVNNLYNYQWNADIMAAPAHNLARQRDTALLVFLDNESGLLHGYRLLKKYEAYHGLLLDNLCVFRRPTVEALRRLRADGVADRLQRMFEATTANGVRDVLPPLPEKSIKILNDRIDRVLGQVQKCREMFSSR